MTIRVFLSGTCEQPCETHEWTGTLAGFFASKGLAYTLAEQPKSHVTVNGQSLPMLEWADRHLDAGDDVEMRLIQHGGVFSGLGKLLGSIFNFAFGWLMPKSGSQNYGSPEQGQRLETTSAKANQPKLGDVVPELAGRFRRFPDYLTPPRRRFVNWREQWLEFHACIGPGQYQIHDADVKVGDTPFSALGADGSYAIYGPGADLSGTSTHEHWHTVPAVGGTSSGTAGLEMSTELANRENTQPASYSFDGSYIWRSSESEFPPGWGAGTIVNIHFPQQFEVTRPDTTFPNPQRNRFTGAFKHLMPFSGFEGLTMEFGGQRYDVLTGAMDLDENGDGWIEFVYPKEDPEEPTSWVNFVPLGQQTIVFQRSPVPRYSIQQYSADNIVVWRLLPNGQSDPSWRGFPQVTTGEATVTFNGGTVYGEWSSEFVATPGKETTTGIEIDFFFPNGLGYIRDNGDVTTQGLGIEIQYRNADGGPRTTISKWYENWTLDQIGITESISVPQMRPAVRVRRVGASATSTQVKDTIQWYGLKSRLRTRTSYPRWTTMAAKLRVGGRLGAQSENQINVVATRMLPVLQSDGTWSASQPTRDISAFARYITGSIGYSDLNLDADELQRLDAIWKARGETLDHVYDLTTAQDALKLAFRAGFSELTVSHGLIRPVRDDVRTQFEQSYSPLNMTKPLRESVSPRKPMDPDGVEVEYIDAETWTSMTVKCLLPGDQGFKLEKLKLDGVTDRVRAWRIGMRRRREQAYRNREYSFGTEMDAFNSEYLSYVPLFDDEPGNAQMGLLVNISPASGGALLRISEPLRWVADVPHSVGYRTPEGKFVGPFVASPGPDDFSIIANIPLPWPEVSLKQELPHVYFGLTADWIKPALITNIQARGTDATDVTAANYDVRVYADDNNNPPD
ncbi:host specificity factor TipJ family phage tail protein [Alcaligenes faecalis]|uniref:host specificity factor TipJ family phage tail protein n=1 Tax=Alcaligenes faecalis TaxID=511 RepID=UPI00211BD7B1|nr:host specificity factor TipJ family phage tail protein [Alcaligenes faecalis]UUO12758.1 host specificity factor TipJ family phage tail protein [Alcaligenes faecalis]